MKSIKFRICLHKTWSSGKYFQWTPWALFRLYISFQLEPHQYYLNNHQVWGGDLYELFVSEDEAWINGYPVDYESLKGWLSELEKESR